MISSSDSLAFALHEIQDVYTEWRKIDDDDGMLFYMNYRFAAKEWLEEFQRELDQIEHFHCITFGPSYGLYPRVVRAYFPLLHAKYPPRVYDAPEEELSAIYRVRRAQREVEFDEINAKRVAASAPKKSTKRKRGQQEETLAEVIERSKYDF